MLLPVAFWLAVSGIAYVYFGYPFVLMVWAALGARPIRTERIEPRVSMLIPAYNEEAALEEKLKSALSLDYPAEKLDITVASDGSTDRTVEVARTYERYGNLRVIDFERNRGKLAVLNEVVPKLPGDIVAFSDASGSLAPDSLRRLVERFADERVGAVSGVYRVVNPGEAQLGNQEDFYWKYETYLKQKESELASILGCHGALYAIRKDLYPNPPQGTINDDFVIPVLIVAAGHRVGYEPTAIAYDEAAEMEGFRRRVRIMTGNFQQVTESLPLFRWKTWREAFFFLSHKMGRLVVPPLMLVALVANLLLLEQPFYQFTLAAQVVFYGLAIAGALLSLPKILRLPHYFTMINVAAVVGLYFRMLGRRPAWRKEA